MSVHERCEEADKDTKAGPHAWIQWKGTNVCMDVHCDCGAHTHVDADFTYFVKCGACGKLWAMCANVRMIPVTEAEIEGQCEPRVSSTGDEDRRPASEAAPAVEVDNLEALASLSAPGLALLEALPMRPVAKVESTGERWIYRREGGKTPDGVRFIAAPNGPPGAQWWNESAITSEIQAKIADALAPYVKPAPLRQIVIETTMSDSRGLPVIVEVKP